jgi:hypothetical protein
MTRARTLRAALAGAAAPLLVVACGGGAGGGDLAGPLLPDPVDGIDRSGVTVGTVSSFGSIFVDGVEFATDDATILRGDTPIAEDDLAVGLVVTVEGEIDPDGSTGVAERVRYLPEVTGPVQTLDPSRGRFTVLGREIRTDRSTIFAAGIVPEAVTGLAPGDVVEVSGYVTGDDRVLATRVVRLTGATAFSRSGTVAAWDPAAVRFRLGALEVDAAAADLVCDAAGIENGRPVEVRADAAPQAGVLLATVVRCLPRRPLESDRDDDFPGRLEGLVTRFGSVTDFDVAGQPVTTDAATRFENGTAGALGRDVRVEVVGTTTPAGVLRAAVVEFPVTVNRELEGRIASLPPELRLAGFEEIEIRTDAETQFEDDTDAEVRRGLLEALRVGDFLEVKGRFDPAAGTLLARRIEREDEDDDGDGDDEGETSLEGPLVGLDASGGSVLGVAFTFTAETRYAVGGVVVTAAEFLATATDGETVDLLASPAGDGTFEARSIDLLRDDDDDDDDGGDDAGGSDDVEGTLETIDETGVVVDGLAYAFDDATRYFDDDGFEVSASVFLDLVTPGDEVELDVVGAPDAPLVLRIELD